MFINFTKSDGNSISINSDYIEYYNKTNKSHNDKLSNTEIFCKSHTFYVKETKEFIDKLLETK